MNNRETALEYLRCFCAGDIDGLAPLLAADLSFTGTLHEFHTASEYLASLRADPPVNSLYKVLSITESDESVAVFYQYQIEDREIRLAQLFRIRESKIHDVLLVFHGRGMT